MLLPIHRPSCLGFFSVVAKCCLQKQVKGERSHNLRLQATWQGSDSGRHLEEPLPAHLPHISRAESSEHIHACAQLLDGPASSAQGMILATVKMGLLTSINVVKSPPQACPQASLSSLRLPSQATVDSVELTILIIITTLQSGCYCHPSFLGRGAEAWKG